MWAMPAKPDAIASVAMGGALAVTEEKWALNSYFTLMNVSLNDIQEASSFHTSSKETDFFPLLLLLSHHVASMCKASN